MSDKRKLYKQYFTSNNIASLIVENISAEKPKNIIDLSVGEGELLLACHKKWEVATLFGVDIDEVALNKARERLPDQVSLYCGDGVSEFNTFFNEFNNVMKGGGFDLCIGNPPFDSYHKVRIGNKEIQTPLEYLFIKRYLSICRPLGIIAVIIPNGILTNKTYKFIREEILSYTRILKIISLPLDAFPQVNAKTEVLVLQKNFDKKQKFFNIEFINLENLSGEVKFQKIISENDLLNRMDFSFYAKKTCMQTYKLSSDKIELSLKDIVLSHNRGSTDYGEKRFFVEQGLRYIHTTNISAIGICFEKEELFVKENSNMDKKSARLRVNDFLFVRVGKNCVGRVAVVTDEAEIGVASDCLYIFRLKDIQPLYAAILFKTNFMKNKLEPLIHGSCANVISKSDLLNINVPLLPKEQQQYFSLEYSKILAQYNKGKGINDDVLKSIMQHLNELINHLDDLLWREWYAKVPS